MQSKYILLILVAVAFFISIIARNSIEVIDPNETPANWGTSIHLQKISQLAEELFTERDKLRDEVDDLLRKNNVLNAEVNHYHSKLIECNVKSDSWIY